MGKWIEGLVIGAIALTVCGAALARVLPALTGPIVAVGLVAAVLRVVWFMTR